AVGPCRGPRGGVPRCNGALQHVRTRHAAQRLRALERLEAAADQELVPARAILIKQEHRLARWSGPRAQARGLQLHESNQAMNFRLGRGKVGQVEAWHELMLADVR